MLAALCAFFALLPPSAPRYTLDVREAPTAAVFAMMLGGNTTSVMRHFPADVSLRLTEAQVTLPPPDIPGRSGYGDYWPIGGWIAEIGRATGAKDLLVGYEREGGNFYVSCTGKPNTAGAEVYRENPESAYEGWHRVGAAGDYEPSAPLANMPRSGLRLAAVRWVPDPSLRRAILVIRALDGGRFARVVRKGDTLGIAGYRVAEIEAGTLSLTGSAYGPIRLRLRKED